jgi:hypothetical protein
VAPASPAKRNSREVAVNDAKARRERGYAPLFSIEDGIKELKP